MVYDGYDIAQICLNGHIVNDSFQNDCEKRQDYCEDCGSKTIAECPQCHKAIRGAIYYDYIPVRLEKAPGYCLYCGNPFPWTEEKKNAAIELADLLDELSADEKEQLKRSLDDLVKDGPRTPVATTRFKRIIAKTGSEIAVAFKDILVDVVSETAKKGIWG